MNKQSFNAWGLIPSILIALVTVISISCSDDQEKKSGSFLEVDGEKIPLAKGTISYDEHRDDGELLHYDNILILYSKGLEIVKNEDDEEDDGGDLVGKGDMVMVYFSSPVPYLEEGTYIYDNSNEVHDTFMLAEFFMYGKVSSNNFDELVFFSLKEAQMTVTKNGSLYSITLDGIGTLKREGDVEGQEVPVSLKYVGKLNVQSSR